MTHYMFKTIELPNQFKVVGIVISSLTLILAILYLFLFTETNTPIESEITFLNEDKFLRGLNFLGILGLFFIFFSKEKNEDERTLLLKEKQIVRNFSYMMISYLMYLIIYTLFNIDLEFFGNLGLQAMFVLLVSIVNFYFYKGEC